MKKMNKFILSLGLIAVAFSLTNCVQSNDFDAPINSAPEFSLYADAPSRTANDGVNTLWVEGDNLNVFHAVAESTEYVNDQEFTLADIAKGLFKGTLGEELSSEVAYDWYICYPYHSALDKPGYGSSYNIGNTKNSGKQVQTGNNSSAHISGKYLPLVGVTKGVAANEAPALRLKNAASFAKFIVKNTLSEPITITEISISAPGHHLTGNFYIHFADIENISYVAKSGDTSDTATLSVLNGTPIAANGTAEFYLAVAPFAKEAGSDATITITATNGDGVVGECIKDATAAAMTFTAGLYKEITLNYNEPFETLPSVSTETAPHIVCFEASEGFVATTTYKTAEVRYTGEEGKQWATVYGTPSTTDKISGEQSMHMKIYDLGGGVWSNSYTYTNFTLSSVKEVRFDATNESYNDIKLSYKTAGQDWTDLQTFTLAGATVKNCKYTFDAPVKNAQFKFTIVNDSPTNSKHVIIDNVVFASEDLAEDFNPVTATIKVATENASDTDTAAGTTATLNGSYTLIDGTDSDVVVCGFEYKLSSASSYTTVTATAEPSFSYNLTGLTTDATYTYRAWASLNGGEKLYGEEKGFTPKKMAATTKTIALTQDDIKAVNATWDYADTDHYIATSYGNWPAKHAYRKAKAQTEVQIKKKDYYGYLATPIVNGKITKVVTTIRSNSATNSFAVMAGSEDNTVYTSANMGKTTTEYTIDITGDYNQVFIRSANGVIYIQSVTVYYE